MKPGGIDHDTLVELAARCNALPDEAGWFISRAYWLGRGLISNEQALMWNPQGTQLRLVDDDERAPDTPEERLQKMEQERGGPANDGDQ